MTRNTHTLGTHGFRLPRFPACFRQRSEVESEFERAFIGAAGPKRRLDLEEG